MNDYAALLRMLEVRAGYTQPVVGPVSLEVWPGEVVGLTGLNGVGKTTLLKLLTGEARLFGGEVQRAAGLTVAHHRQQPERPPELPLTGHEVLRLAGAEATAVPARLQALHRRCLDEMSGGEYQLLHAWSCLMGPARLVLLDEPTNNLDQEAIELLLGKLEALAPERAVLMVSHEPEVLRAACSRVVSLCH